MKVGLAHKKEEKTKKRRNKEEDDEEEHAERERARDPRCVFLVSFSFTFFPLSFSSKKA